MINKLHIVSFDVPFPTNYGGVIDVFYKLKALHKLGIEIYLHVFEYGRGEQKELLKYCKEVFYYPRNSFIKSFFSKSPFIVKSGGKDLLINKVIKEGWFNDIADADFAIDMRKILTHIVYSPSGGIVNYRLSDVKKGLGSLVMMLVLQKNRNKELCSTGWEDIKDDLTATVKKGFRREIKADMDLNWTGLNMQQFNEELQNRLDKRVLQWEESMIDLFRI